MLDKLQGWDYNPDDEAYQGGGQSQDFSDYAASRDGKAIGTPYLNRWELLIISGPCTSCRRYTYYIDCRGDSDAAVLCLLGFSFAAPSHDGVLQATSMRMCRLEFLSALTSMRANQYTFKRTQHLQRHQW
jgi:hypothetical protein